MKIPTADLAGRAVTRRRRGALRKRLRDWAVLWAGIALSVCAAAAGRGADAGRMEFQPVPGGQFHFDGLLGDRIDANIENWLLKAPSANPGMIGMFHLRDRKPEPKLVPWAGEFAGKYLTSAILALRMDARPELHRTVKGVVEELIASQAEDGYLGPFPKAVRLRGNWDLWGHYHCMLALLMWHEREGDPAALASARRAADLVCRTFLDSGARVFDAGSHEMNMSILHVMAKLHRITGEPRYLRMAREIEKDWERAGDYLRTGLAGKEFFQTPLPRWESLHDLQGLVELHRITGEQKYRDAFLHHWRSILRWDRRNSGAFSGGEKATGNAFEPSPIETCCTVAWMALTLDALALSGDSRCADELELSTFNAAAGAQHPSGRWWTYNTPMDGVREASAHSIVFQARAGTPELNCCSVNGPRSLGMLAEWAVMSARDGLAVNWYGPGMFQGKLPNGAPVAIKIETNYPVSNEVSLRIDPLVAREFQLQLRIPSWSRRTPVFLNQRALTNAVAGSYLSLQRRWQPGDRVKIEFDFGLRTLAGEREMLGKVSVYRGPLLLVWDQRDNVSDEDAIPPLDLSRLGELREPIAGPPERPLLAPWLRLDLPAKGGGSIRVRDFASAGISGERYRSWLAAEQGEKAGDGR